MELLKPINSIIPSWGQPGIAPATPLSLKGSLPVDHSLSKIDNLSALNYSFLIICFAECFFQIILPKMQYSCEYGIFATN